VALRGFDLSVGENEFVALVGTSGCGKSTLLSIAAGLETYDEGSIAVDGEPVTRPGLDRGVVFQSYTLLPWLTTIGNVEFALRAAGTRRRDTEDIARDHLALVGLDAFAEAYPAELSGGMKQRVAIARALSYRPKILLMDEPFGALDPLTRAEIQREFLALQERLGKTIVFVTHDIREALIVGTRIALLESGKLVGTYSRAGFLSSGEPAVTAYLSVLRAGDRATES